MNVILSLVGLACTGVIIGCATSIPFPAELTEARQAYAHASINPGAQLESADLHKAREALVLAEQSFIDDPTSMRTRDLANHANREARIAEMDATTASDSAAAAQAK